MTVIPNATPFSAEADASRSRGSRRGTIAVRVAMPTEFAAATVMLSAYSHQIVTSWVQVRVTSSAVEAKATTAAISATRRRSKASASMPP